MRILPKILVQIDKKQEVSLFLKFLNHPEFPIHRKTLLQVFPELKELLENSKSDEGAVRDFIDQFYLKHEDAISSAIQNGKEEMKKSQMALKALGESMDYHWHNDISYIAMPTILPFSPFNKNTFYFSILGQVLKGDKKNVLLVAIHEISHFIFFEILKEIEDTEKILLAADTKYYLKEALTAALFNEELLRRELKINNYLGNPEIRDIYLMDQTGSVKILADYIRERYIESKKNNRNFKEFLTKITLAFNEISEEFSKKRKIWNQWGKELFKNESILADYRQPIELKRPGE
jgi:hypothetical protein